MNDQITENVTPFQSFYHSGILKTDTIGRHVSCTNGIINQLQRGFMGMGAYMLLDNSDLSITESYNVSTVTNVAGNHLEVAFTNELDQHEYLVLLNMWRNGVGVYSTSWHDFGFWSYRNTTSSGVDLYAIYNHMAQTSVGDIDNAGISHPVSLFKKTGDQGGYDYLSMIILQ